MRSLLERLAALGPVRIRLLDTDGSRERAVLETSSARSRVELSVAGEHLAVKWDIAACPKPYPNCHMAQKPRHVRSCPDNGLGFYYARLVKSSRR